MCCFDMLYSPTSTVGMAVWYIGAGHGDGNPYGIVIATVRAITPSSLSSILMASLDGLYCSFPSWPTRSSATANDVMDSSWCHYRV